MRMHIHLYIHVYIPCIQQFNVLANSLRGPSRRMTRSLTVHTVWNTLQHTATHCNTLQHTATHPEITHLLIVHRMFNMKKKKVIALLYERPIELTYFGKCLQCRRTPRIFTRQRSRRVSICGEPMQRGTVCCSVRATVAVRWSVLQRGSTYCSAVPCVAVQGQLLQCDAVCCSKEATCVVQCSVL